MPTVTDQRISFWVVSQESRFRGKSNIKSKHRTRKLKSGEGEEESEVEIFNGGFGRRKAAEKNLNRFQRTSSHREFAESRSACGTVLSRLLFGLASLWLPRNSLQVCGDGLRCQGMVWLLRSWIEFENCCEILIIHSSNFNVERFVLVTILWDYGFWLAKSVSEVIGIYLLNLQVWWNVYCLSWRLWRLGKWNVFNTGKWL